MPVQGLPPLLVLLELLLLLAGISQASFVAFRSSAKVVSPRTRGITSTTSTSITLVSVNMNLDGNLDMDHDMEKQVNDDRDLAPVDTTTSNKHETKAKAKKKKQRPRIPILQYHKDWLCVNKPAGMSVHPSGSVSKWRQDLIVGTLLKQQLKRKVWPVHRLDHRSSGALLFAFSSQVCGRLHASLTHKQDAAKIYIALLRGDWTNLPETIIVDKQLTDDGISREAQTEFTCLATLSTESSKNATKESSKNATTEPNHDEYRGACTLVACRLLTGRKHQIRRHAFAIGHPVLGDSEHGNSKVNRWWRENRGLNRLFLHCLSLDLPPMGLGCDVVDHTMDEDIIVVPDADVVTGSNQTVFAENADTNNSDLERPRRIQCVAPLSPELSTVLQRDELRTLWEVAVKKEPRLALEPYDEKGWTTGKQEISKETMPLGQNDTPVQAAASDIQPPAKLAS